jgi:formylglycine-generating enzyme required for sulfatase activity
MLRFFTLSLLLILTSCSKKPVEVTGQIFVITQGRENIKMGGVEVLVVPDEEFRKKAKEVVTWMQQEVKAEAQRKVDSDHMTDFINWVIELEKTSSFKIPELPKIREGIVKESDMASGLIESAMKRDLQTRSFIKMFVGDGEKMVFTTDADGKFTLPLRGKAWFHAMAERQVGDNSEGYIWLKGFQAPDGASKASLVIANDDDIKDEDELYSMLAGVCEVQGQLENFRKVDVSENMKSLVKRYREEAESAEAKAEKDAAEAKAQAERDVAETKAKADEAYKKFSGSRAGEERIIEIVPGVKMTFCWCPPGEFMMGSPASEEDRSDDEDQVKVTINNGFWMAKTELTQAQWQAVMGSNPSHFKGENQPIEMVRWSDSQKFIEKLNASIGSADGGWMSLPTEAQWEYAARAGEMGPHPGGPLQEVAWYGDNCGNRPHPVGAKRSNAWGLHDMLGNVWEWCADWYDDDLSGGVDPKGAAKGPYRVCRGGLNYDYADGNRVASRYCDMPENANQYTGFRVVRSSVPANNPSAPTNTSTLSVNFSGCWETEKLNAGGGGWTQIWLEIKQKDDQISGVYSVGYFIGDEPQEGDDGNQNPFIGTVKGNTATIKFDPENFSPGYLENVKYQDPADGKSPASATFTMSGESLIVNVTEREIVEGLRAKIAFKKTK